MIKLEKVNKYYNKGKTNQIHVINDTTMGLPQKGLVCILGPSGCGKTTLLNAMGGLDSVDMGSITVDGEQITRRSANHIDDVRNAKIGYVFQNYNLLDDKSVFENVAIVLRLAGISDEQLISDRVLYCLKSVGILQYRKKSAGALSGGQRQRVGIARALAKNPKIIIADEPTGNLDSANTLEIMNIIKAISRDKLVVLVTHERKIAEFYADYIAEMLDGTIVKSYSNDSSRYLDCRLDNKIYLQDMPIQDNYSKEGVKVKLYSDDDKQIDVKLVVKGGNIYIDTGGKYNVIDESGNVDLVDAHYQRLDESYYDEVNFDYCACLPEDFTPRYSRLYSFKKLIKNGWSTVKGFRTIKKFFLIGFVFAAMFAFLAISNVIGIVDVQPQDYTRTNSNYITVKNPSKGEDVFELVEALDGVKYVLPGETTISLTLPLNDYYQTAQAYDTLNVSLAYSSVLKDEDIVCGRKPNAINEVVIDKVATKTLLKSSTGKAIGLKNNAQLIGRKLQVPNMQDLLICGISDTQSPSMYVLEGQAIDILANAKQQLDVDEETEAEFSFAEELVILDIYLAPDSMKITSGATPKKKYEVLLDSSHEGEFKVGDKLDTSIAGNKLVVAGFYSKEQYDDVYYASLETVKAYHTSKNQYFTVYSEKPDATLLMLEKAKLTASKNADRDKAIYIRKMANSLRSSFIVAGIILLISLLEMYLMLRSSFLTRIKEIGVLRAIGVKKGDIYRMFTGEILVITTITAIPGILIMYYLIKNVVEITDFIKAQYEISPLVALISFAVLIIFNLLVGLLPVFRTMRKTPAEILARTDI